MHVRVLRCAHSDHSTLIHACARPNYLIAGLRAIRKRQGKIAKGARNLVGGLPKLGAKGNHGPFQW